MYAEGTGLLCVKRRSLRGAPRFHAGTPCTREHKCPVLPSDPYTWLDVWCRELACKPAPRVSCYLSGLLRSVSSPLTPTLKLPCMLCAQVTLGHDVHPSGSILIPQAPRKAQGESERFGARGRCPALLLTLQVAGSLCGEEGRWPGGTEGGPWSTASKVMGPLVLQP